MKIYILAFSLLALTAKGKWIRYQIKYGMYALFTYSQLKKKKLFQNNQKHQVNWIRHLGIATEKQMWYIRCICAWLSICAFTISQWPCQGTEQTKGNKKFKKKHAKKLKK